jgi:hypothetical protein
VYRKYITNLIRYRVISDVGSLSECVMVNPIKRIFVKFCLFSHKFSLAHISVSVNSTAITDS